MSAVVSWAPIKIGAPFALVKVSVPRSVPPLNASTCAVNAPGASAWISTPPASTADEKPRVSGPLPTPVPSKVQIRWSPAGNPPVQLHDGAAGHWTEVNPESPGAKLPVIVTPPVDVAVNPLAMVVPSGPSPP